jgi:hypothetical protein
MLKLRPHHRIRIPNSLAVFAAMLLLISTVAGIDIRQSAVASGQESGIAVKAESAGANKASQVAEKKPRGLNLGLLLFRRG